MNYRIMIADEKNLIDIPTATDLFAVCTFGRDKCTEKAFALGNNIKNCFQNPGYIGFRWTVNGHKDLISVCNENGEIDYLYRAWKPNLSEDRKKMYLDSFDGGLLSMATLDNWSIPIGQLVIDFWDRKDDPSLRSGSLVYTTSDTGEILPGCIVMHKPGVQYQEPEGYFIDTREGWLFRFPKDIFATEAECRNSAKYLFDKQVHQITDKLDSQAKLIQFLYSKCEENLSRAEKAAVKLRASCQGIGL